MKIKIIATALILPTLLSGCSFFGDSYKPSFSSKGEEVSKTTFENRMSNDYNEYKAFMNGNFPSLVATIKRKNVYSREEKSSKNKEVTKTYSSRLRDYTIKYDENTNCISYAQKYNDKEKGKTYDYMDVERESKQSYDYLYQPSENKYNTAIVLIDKTEKLYYTYSITYEPDKTSRQMMASFINGTDFEYYISKINGYSDRRFYTNKNVYTITVNSSRRYDTQKIETVATAQFSYKNGNYTVKYSNVSTTTTLQSGGDKDISVETEYYTATVKAKNISVKPVDLSKYTRTDSN